MISLERKRYANNQQNPEFNASDYDYSTQGVTLEDLLSYARIDSFNSFQLVQTFLQGARFLRQIAVNGLTLLFTNASGSVVKEESLTVDELYTLKDASGNIQKRLTDIESTYMTRNTLQTVSATKQYVVDSLNNTVDITSLQMSNIQYLDNTTQNIDDRFKAIEANYVTTNTDQRITASKRYQEQNNGAIFSISQHMMTKIRFISDMTQSISNYTTLNTVQEVTSAKQYREPGPGNTPGTLFDITPSNMAKIRFIASMNQTIDNFSTLNTVQEVTSAKQYREPGPGNTPGTLHDITPSNMAKIRFITNMNQSIDNYLTTNRTEDITATKRYQEIVNSIPAGFVSITAHQMSKVRHLENTNFDVSLRFTDHNTRITAIEANYVTTNTDQQITASKRYQEQNNGAIFSISQHMMTKIRFIEGMTQSITLYSTLNTTQEVTSSKQYREPGTGNSPGTLFDITPSNMAKIRFLANMNQSIDNYLTTNRTEDITATKRYQEIVNSTPAGFVSITAHQMTKVRHLENTNFDVSLRFTNHNDRITAIEANYVTTNTSQQITAVKRHSNDLFINGAALYSANVFSNNNSDMRIANYAGNRSIYLNPDKNQAIGDVLVNTNSKDSNVQIEEGSLRVNNALLTTQNIVRQVEYLVSSVSQNENLYVCNFTVSQYFNKNIQFTIPISYEILGNASVNGNYHLTYSMRSIQFKLVEFNNPSRVFWTGPMIENPETSDILIFFTVDFSTGFVYFRFYLNTYTFTLDASLFRNQDRNKQYSIIANCRDRLLRYTTVFGSTTVTSITNQYNRFVCNYSNSDYFFQASSTSSRSSVQLNRLGSLPYQTSSYQLQTAATKYDPNLTGQVFCNELDTNIMRSNTHETTQVTANTIQTNNINVTTGNVITINNNISLQQGIQYNAGIGLYVFNDTTRQCFPIFCSQNRIILEDLDVCWVIMAGYRAQLYQNVGYSSNMYLLDNTNGNFPMIRLSTEIYNATGRISSVKLFFRNIEITVPTIS